MGKSIGGRQNRIKIYVLTTSKVFMNGHPRAGDPTNFREKILSGEKIHTIRSGFHWEKVVYEVNAGKAILSLREWTGRPYASKQEEYIILHKVGWQPIELTIDGVILIDGLYANQHLETIANNDGLSDIDFIRWFRMGYKPFKGGIIHFTDFRY